jgi:hypothetical protein
MLSHTFSDGSVLQRVSAKDLIQIPVWKGNRTLDEAHANKIQQDIGSNIQCLDSTIFRIVKYREKNAVGDYIEQRYVIDGQHRLHVLKHHYLTNLYEADFPVLMVEKRVESESEAIEYFNTINNVKPMHLDHDDPNVLVNKYILALEKEFNKDKKHPLIRAGSTKRPYLSSDAVRTLLTKHVNRLSLSSEKIDMFVSKVSAWNAKQRKEFPLRLLNIKEKNATWIEAAVKKEFCLAFDAKLLWVTECL